MTSSLIEGKWTKPKWARQVAVGKNLTHLVQNHVMVKLTNDNVAYKNQNEFIW